MPKAVLTRYGIADPAATMEAFHEIGEETLANVLKITTAPKSKKTLKTWGVYAAAEMIGKTSQTIRQLEKSHKLRQPKTDEKGKRYYTLSDINYIRNMLGTRFKRPLNSDPMTVAITNFKGGVAKTTTSILLSQKCALDGLRVLLIDLDPQATLSLFFGYLPDTHLTGDDTIASALVDNPKDISKVIKKTYFNGIDIVPGNLELQNVELILPNTNLNKTDTLGSPLKRLLIALSNIKELYDVIILDCGPNLGALTINAVAAANAMLVPIPPSMPGFGSYVSLTKTLSQLFSVVKPNLDFFRLILTKHKGTNAANLMDQVMREKFGSYILVNHMVETAEIDNTSSALTSIYEKPTLGTKTSTFRRALDAANQLNTEIISAFKAIWDAQAKTHTEN